ncbi:hypothetical protein TNCT_201811 [Trichonephila clavata]|uniref:Uncharacterized protein n=1 Tax=Trichonephila clavata TaxID=2740835 RepID=A0A8X6HXB1_TRICU|nr:hypothetical protein TNCT_201811 [Trichonephila clavata]
MLIFADSQSIHRLDAGTSGKVCFIDRDNIVYHRSLLAQVTPKINDFGRPDTQPLAGKYLSKNSDDNFVFEDVIACRWMSQYPPPSFERPGGLNPESETSRRITPAHFGQLPCQTKITSPIFLPKTPPG